MTSPNTGGASTLIIQTNWTITGRWLRRQAGRCPAVPAFCPSGHRVGSRASPAVEARFPAPAAQRRFLVDSQGVQARTHPEVFVLRSRRGGLPRDHLDRRPSSCRAGRRDQEQLPCLRHPQPPQHAGGVPASHIARTRLYSTALAKARTHCALQSCATRRRRRCRRCCRRP